ncbi:UDP-N-acetylmuramoylalanine--D-glutamate ligase [uncultured Defluviicoccus sp.]|uniref:UDP-N-acetylmuramoylalanine--D-glutamate ligase n=1 Tax=metagenome TaxID=256318 RepID=A0A380T7S2_9ZZZZ|nr:UDP-N-acetylmuramoylalanine--D-glutamate ligase [uncultured Defluviicoccus sp.]
MIPLHGLPDKPYAVLGLGISGLAACRALIASGKSVWAWDDSAAARGTADSAGIPLFDLAGADLASAAALILSPGIPHTHPQPHPVVARARQAGCPVIGDGELLARARIRAECVGITGTNGKSTTTALIGHILQAAGRRCAVGGNLGTPILALDALDPTSVYVLEMSSYQLELTPNLVFNTALLLNISPDHLGRHGGMEGYIAAKTAIFRDGGPSATAIVGADDAACRRIGRTIAASGRRRVVFISGQTAVPGGVYALDGTLYDDRGGGRQAVLDLAAAKALPGVHNAQNAAAALAAALALGVSHSAAAEAIASFPGLAHRQERIAVIDGVLFVNDSKATNVDAAVRALACYDAIYWIAGGRPKEGGLAGIEPSLAPVRAAFLIGEAEADFAATLAGKVPVQRCGALAQAVAAAARAAWADRSRAEGAAQPVVLLSPACASFDQFRSFEHRGDVFRTLVGELQR